MENNLKIKKMPWAAEVIGALRVNGSFHLNWFKREKKYVVWSRYSDQNLNSSCEHHVDAVYCCFYKEHSGPVPNECPELRICDEYIFCSYRFPVTNALDALH